jgi:hypothetical protein
MEATHEAFLIHQSNAKFPNSFLHTSKRIKIPPQTHFINQKLLKQQQPRNLKAKS